MEVNLIVVGGKYSGRVIPVPGPLFLIGRADECQMRAQSDRISRRHCEIQLEEGRVLVRDCGSKNGTFVNGQRLERDHELKGGDRLQVGSLEFEVQLTVSVSGKKKSKVHNVHEAAARMVETAAGEEPDISDWLNDDDGEEDQAPDTANLHDTKPVPIPAQTEPAPQEPAPEKKKAHISELRPASRKPPTLFDEEPEKKVTAESSRQAAADMLKQFFHRKP